MLRTLSLLFALLLLTACTGLPKSVEPVDDFELDKYLGTWYEIARLDNRFERGLRNITANYAVRDDGGVAVTNRGYSEKKGEWVDAVGKAYFVGKADTAHLKVSFFGPFYATYAVFELDSADYQYAFVSGNSHKYLWFLSRTPTVSDDMMEQFYQKAQNSGFDTSKLIIVDHSSEGLPQ